MSYPTDTFGRVAPAENRRIPAMPPNPCWLLNLDQIEKETGYLGQPELTDPSSASTSTYAFTTDHVLYSKLRPNLNKVVCPDRPGLCTTELIRMRPDPKRLTREFLTFYLRSEYYMGFARQVVAGAKMPRMVMDRFWQHEIPLPHPLEQDRIVEILDQADALRQQRRKADALSQRILPALFHEMFGDPNRNEREWPTLPLDEAFDDVSRQGNKIPRSEYLTAGKIPVIDQGQDEIAGYWDEVGDAYRGKLPVILFGDHTRIFKLLEHPFCIGADGVRLLRPKTMDSHFAFGLLTLLDVPSRGYSRHYKELRALSYINPPPDRQERFGKAFAELRKQSAKATTSAATLETLFQTLLHRAFDGSLTAKWREGQGKELLQEMEYHSKR
jgi:type I restriction enzyme S subunit